MELTDAQITQYAQQGETELAKESRLIVVRIVLDIKANTSEYVLPDSLISIKQITYKGFPLEPYGMQGLVSSGTYPGNTVMGRPLNYVYSGKGFNLIKLVPTPNETLAPTPGEDPWSVSVIQNKVVMEYISIPIFTTTTTRIPSHLRRLKVKDYVLYRAYQKQGKMFDQKAAAYFKNKFKRDESSMRALVEEYTKCIELILQPDSSRINHPRRPSLPQNFGIIEE